MFRIIHLIYHKELQVYICYSKSYNRTAGRPTECEKYSSVHKALDFNEPLSLVTSSNVPNGPYLKCGIV